MKIPEIADGTKIPLNLIGGDFFAEAFASWRNEKIDKNDPDLQWIIAFFNLSL